MITKGIILRNVNVVVAPLTRYKLLKTLKQIRVGQTWRLAKNEIADFSWHKKKTINGFSH